MVYRNEHHIGEALKTLLPKYNLQRKDIFITSKLIPSVNQPDHYVENLVKTSLQNLNTDYIDCYLIHWPGVSGLDVKHPDNKKYRVNTWKTLIKLHKSGLIRSIGVSNYMVNHLQEMLEYSDGILPALNQVEWHPYNHQSELLEYCQKNNIFLQAYSSLGTSNYSTLRVDSTIVAIAKKLNKTPAQILLRWSYQQNIGIIPKASEKSRIEENYNLDFEIPAEDLKTLNNFEVKERFAWNPEPVV